MISVRGVAVRWRSSSHSRGTAHFIERVSAEIFVSSETSSASWWRSACEHVTRGWEVTVRRRPAHSHAHWRWRWHSIHGWIWSFATATDTHRWWVSTTLEHVSGVFLAPVVIVEVSESIDDAVSQEG